MAYSGPSKKIKNALKTVLEGIEYDAGSGDEPAMYVKDSSHGAFDGYPAVRILPADIGNDKSSTAEQERAPAYLLMVHLPMEDTPESESETYDKMYDLTDLIMDTLDQGDRDNVLTT